MATLLSTGIPNLGVTADGIYYGYRKTGGVKRNVSFLTRDRSEAIEKLHDFMAADKSDMPTNRKVKCRRAFAEFIATGYGPKKKLAPATLKLYEGLWRLYVDATLGNMRVVDVEPKHIIKVLEAARKKGVSGSRLRNLYVTMSAFFTMMTVEPTRYRTSNPVAHIGIQNRPVTPEPTRVGDDVVLSREDIDRIAAGFGDSTPTRPGRYAPSQWLATMMRVLFLTLCQSGLRVSEALALTIDDVQYRSGQLHAVGELPFLLEVKRQRNFAYRAKDPNSQPFAPLKGDVGKTVGQARRIPLSPFIARELASYIEQGLASGHLRPGGLLFPNTRQKMLDPKKVSERIQAAAARVGIDRYVTTHLTRHTYISLMVENGVDTKVIAEIAGHSEKVLRERYLHRSKDSQAYDVVAAAGWQ